MKNWDRAYQKGETPWDKGNPCPQLLEYLSNYSIEGQVLVPGCGRGHDVRALASSRTTVLGMDLSPVALREADSFKKNFQTEYILRDFLVRSPNEDNSYDWIFEHTCFCALEVAARPAYFEAVTNRLKSGGKLLAVLFNKVSNYDGAGPPHPVATEDFIEGFGEKMHLEDRWISREHYPDRPYAAEEVVLLRRV